MNNQPNLDELLCDYLDGALDQAAKARLDAALAADPRLQKTLAELAATKQFLRELPLDKAPLHLSDAIAEEIARPAPRFGLFSRSRVLALAACLMLAISGGVVLQMAMLNPHQQPAMTLNDLALPTAHANGRSAGTLDNETAFRNPQGKQDQMRVAATPAPAPAAPASVAAPLKIADAAVASNSDFSGKNTQVMFVMRAGDLPALEREIDDLLLEHNNRSDGIAKRRQLQRGSLHNAQELDVSSIVATNLSADQFARIRGRLLNMQRRGVKVVEQSPLRQEQAISQQAPSIANNAAQDIYRNNNSNQAIAMDRQINWGLSQRAEPTTTYIDLTILLEPQTLPSASAPATLPVSAPRR